MREIKFRAWHKFEKVMEYFNNPYIPDSDYWDGCKGTRLEMVNGIFNNNKDEIEWMQFTGLKDDNGKEIYEGDVIEFLNGKSQIVEWNDDTCEFQFSDGSPINNGETYGVCKFVIGNIHENPELL